MQLRRKLLFVFLTVNLLTVVGLLLYVEQEGERLRREQEARDLVRQDAERGILAALDLLKLQLQEAISRELERLLDQGLGEHRLPLEIRRIPLFEQPLFTRLVDKGVLMKKEEGAIAPTFFNLPRRFIFDEHTPLDKGDARELVEASLDNRRLEQKGNRVAGPVRARGHDWGGFYLALHNVPSTLAIEPSDPAVSVRNLLLILLPGMLFLFWFLWDFVSRGVIEPIEGFGRVALAVANGDYSRRLAETSRRDEIGRLTNVLNRMLDLVEDYRETMETRIAEKTVEIERKNRELMLGQRLAATGTLAAGIAHEINNPLGGMMNALGRLKREDLSWEQRERYFELLEDCIERIGAIVKKVLAVAPAQTTPALIDLTEVMRRAADLVAHRARQKGVALRIIERSDVPLVLGAANEIGQVFLNLLINGVDACAAGGSVEARIGRDDRHAVVEVEDDGTGMEPDVAARAFDLFFTTKEAGEGTGLGLATVHHLVQAHGGSLELWSEPRKGTRFTVRLPIAPPAKELELR